VTHGTLLTVPVGDALMYVEPVYVRLATANEANFPILRNVIVSYQGSVGIGSSLSDALSSALEDVDTGGDNEPTPPPDEPSETPSGSPTDQPTGTPTTVEDYLALAQQEFVAADRALSAGDLAAYQSHIKKAQDYVNQALNLDGGGGSATPSSGTPSGPSASASP